MRPLLRWARLLDLAAALRRPAVVTASVVVIASSFLPIQAAPAPVVQRVIHTPAPIRAFTPVKLVIKKIGVDAPIVPVWTYEDGRMAEPKTAHEVGWWAG